jgi:hypothetical protein
MAFNYEEILFARTEVIAEPIVARVPSQIGKEDARTRLWYEWISGFVQIFSLNHYRIIWAIWASRVMQVLLQKGLLARWDRWDLYHNAHH